MTNPAQSNDEVICPNCAHQFRAIPVNIQDLLITLGFKPPFTSDYPDNRNVNSALVLQYLALTEAMGYPGPDASGLSPEEWAESLVIRLGENPKETKSYRTITSWVMSTDPDVESGELTLWPESSSPFVLKMDSFSAAMALSNRIEAEAALAAKRAKGELAGEVQNLLSKKIL